jgi:protein SCO1/2
MRRLLIFIAAALVVLVAFAIYQYEARSPDIVIRRAEISMNGAFRLVDQTGRPVSDRDLLGRPTVVFFGYTYCPDVCPTTLTDMTAWLKALGPDADRLNMVYVTIDPERDTPARLKQYLTAFDPRIRGLTGSPAAIAQAARAFKVYYQKVPAEGGDYSMDHSTLIYLMDARGHAAALMPYGATRDEMVAALRLLLRKG